MLRIAGYVVCCLTICFVIFVAIVSNANNSEIIALSATTNSSTPQVPQSESGRVNQIQSDSSVNIVTEAAVKLGVLSCVSRINQVATFLSANNQTGVFIFKPESQPDKHIFSTSFELIRNDNSTFYASASFSPNQDAVYDTVEYVNQSCEELEKTTFKNLKRVGVMKKNIIVLDSGKVKVFLMPAGSGTVVIKKEVIQ